MRYFLENGKRLENMLNKDIYKSVSFSLVSFSVRCIDSLIDGIGPYPKGDIIKLLFSFLFYG